MKPQQYCHTIQFRGSAHLQGRYQLKILEMTTNGQLQYRAQWDFLTLKQLLTFLKTYFPNSRALTPVGQRPLGFENALSIMKNDDLKAA